MDAQKSSKLALEEIRDHNALGPYRRRPRCVDGTLDMRYKVNKSFSKHDRVSDYYDPARPAIDIEEATL